MQCSLEELDPLHRMVLVKHYYGEEGLWAVGRDLGVCPSRASQLHMEALRTLKRAPRIRRPDRSY